mgnify:CR=1 FL=1
MVLEEEEITESTLLNAIRELYQNRESYVHAMSESSHMNSIEKITGLIEDCVNKQESPDYFLIFLGKPASRPHDSVIHIIFCDMIMSGNETRWYVI